MQQFALQLPGSFTAPVFVVLHMAKNGMSVLSELLAKVTALPVVAPSDGAPIECGKIYVAVPDHHLVLDADKVRVMKGPQLHRHRPAVDVLFQSAAEAFGPRVVGVVMTGLLDDGTAGLRAVKRHGGVAVVQDPADALFPDMPASALHNVEVDYCLPLAKIPRLLVKLTRNGVQTSVARGHGQSTPTAEWPSG